MKFVVNYIYPEIQEINKEFLRKENIAIKYPGGKWDLETLLSLCSEGFEIVLHGIIPSSGSFLDLDLCKNMDLWADIALKTNQRWLSFHFDRRKKYREITSIYSVAEENLKAIRKRFKSTPILIENLPPVDGIEGFCANPEIFTEFIKKFDFGMLLDIPHAVISSDILNISFDEYISRFPLERVKEIHFTGVSKLSNGKYYDSHVHFDEFILKKFESVLPKCPNVEYLTLEYSPTRDYDGESIAKKYLEEHTMHDMALLQRQQIMTMKEVYNKFKNNN
ncbi:MAG: DUF692 family protein [Clostridia bacterium]|nr:DUF692 family protein [Clostridia bacterium]